MKDNLQKLREKLDVMLLDEPLNSRDVLCLSQKIDILIAEYYSKQKMLQ
jgi:hypothetical protein